MIIPVKGKWNRDEYVLCPRAPVTVAGLRERMLERARVKEGSYAYRLIGDLHSAIFLQSLDLKADYETYFAREYESFREYLRRRLRFSSPIVARLMKAFDVSSGMYHFRPPYEFLADSYGLEFLNRLLAHPPAGEAS